MTRKPKTREKVNNSGCDFVGRAELRELLGKASDGAVRTVSKPAFPRPVAVRSGIRLWLRGDVEAYVRCQPVPGRRENEMGHLFVDKTEVSARTGLAPKTALAWNKSIPRPAVKSASLNLWLAADFDQDGTD